MKENECEKACPKCGSSETRAISEELRRCKVCRQAFRPQPCKYPTFMDIKEAQRELGEKFK